MGEQEWAVRPCSQPDTEESENVTDLCTLEVRGIEPDTPGEYLSLFFESAKSKGGAIRKMEYTHGSGVALVTFQEQDGWCISILKLISLLCLNLFSG